MCSLIILFLFLLLLFDLEEKNNKKKRSKSLNSMTIKKSKKEVGEREDIYDK